MHAIRDIWFITWNVYSIRFCCCIRLLNMHSMAFPLYVICIVKHVFNTFSPLYVIYIVKYAFNTFFTICSIYSVTYVLITLFTLCSHIISNMDCNTNHCIVKPFILPWQFLSNAYRGVLKTRWHARVQGGFEGYVRDIWRKFGGHLGVFEATRRLPRGKIKNSFTVLFLS